MCSGTATSRLPGQAAMAKFTEKIVAMMKSEGLFESQGGPIILSQIENEYGPVEHYGGAAAKNYVTWAAQMAVGLNTGVPWVMCKQDDAPDPVINACNGFYCDYFSPNKPYKPTMWTEAWTGWFTGFGGPVPHRPVQDMAFAVARFIAKGGSFVNYYMYHGGTNFGRTAGGPFITTSYDYDAPIDEYGLLRQPKWGHLTDLHKAIKWCEPALVSGDPTVTNLGKYQEAHVYRSKSGACAAFLSNFNPHSFASVTFNGMKYHIPAWSVSVLPDCKTVVGAPTSQINMTWVGGFSWKSFSEDTHSLRDKSFSKDGLVEQISMTWDRTDYLWYTTYVDIDSKEQFLKNGRYPFLTVMSAGHSMHVFINGERAGTVYGSLENPKITFTGNVKLWAGSNKISILSVAVGLPNVGNHFETWNAGVLGPVTLEGLNEGKRDLSSQRWIYQIGLRGESLSIYTLSGSSSVKWGAASTRQPLTWYKAFFNAPAGSEPLALDMSSMGKGQIWINGQSIGRYWPAYKANGFCDWCDYRGAYNEKKCQTNCGQPSQKWYHVPRAWLNPTGNLLVVFEEWGGDPSGISMQSTFVHPLSGHTRTKPSSRTVHRLAAPLKSHDFAEIGAPLSGSWDSAPTSTIFAAHRFLHGNSNSNTVAYSSRVTASASSYPVPRPFDTNFAFANLSCTCRRESLNTPWRRPSAALGWLRAFYRPHARPCMSIEFFKFATPLTYVSFAQLFRSLNNPLRLVRSHPLPSTLLASSTVPHVCMLSVSKWACPALIPTVMDLAGYHSQWAEEDSNLRFHSLSQEHPGGKVSNSVGNVAFLASCSCTDILRRQNLNFVDWIVSRCGRILSRRLKMAAWMLSRPTCSGTATSRPLVRFGDHPTFSSPLYYFGGNYDLVRFIKLVKQAGLYVHLRIGPYVCAEWNLGEFPVWLKHVPGINFRSDNGPFKAAMAKFTEKIVAVMKSEGLFESQGGPIILSQQIENEYSLQEYYDGAAAKNYLSWAAQMAVGLNTSVPWVMCKQDDAPDPVINTCNGFYCDYFSPNKPYKPTMWTEAWTGWLTAFGGPVSHRPVQDMAFAVARFIAKGGSFVNYYMYHGGTNFGRTAGGPFITTSYDYDAPIDEYGLLRQPKWGHLTDLHKAIKWCEPALVSGDPTVTNLGKYQEAHVYRSKSGACAAFLSNFNPHSFASVTFNGMKYHIPAWSVSVLPDCKTVVYNTAKVGAPTSQINMTWVGGFSWKSFSEDTHSLRDKSFSKDGLVEQISMTWDRTDYLWYTTYVDIDSKEQFLKNGRYPFLTVMSAGHSMHVFINGERTGTVYGSLENPKITFTGNVKLWAGSNKISILSVAIDSICLFQNVGNHFERWNVGVLGPVTLEGLNEGKRDLSSQRWIYQIGLRGESLSIYTLSGSSSVKWGAASTRQPLTWYKAFFNAPAGSEPLALDMSSMGKGQIWINGQSIGRYWPAYKANGFCDWCDYRGAYNEKKCQTNCGEPSQKWYHVPRAWLNPTGNLLVVFEEWGGDPSGISMVKRVAL
ncbi:unnamed protein product [Musa textilis]